MTRTSARPTGVPMMQPRPTSRSLTPRRLLATSLTGVLALAVSACASVRLTAALLAGAFFNAGFAVALGIFLVVGRFAGTAEPAAFFTAAGFLGTGFFGGSDLPAGRWAMPASVATAPAHVEP